MKIGQKNFLFKLYIICGGFEEKLVKVFKNARKYQQNIFSLEFFP